MTTMNTYIPTLFSHQSGPDDPDPLSEAILGDSEGEHGSKHPTQEPALEDPVARAELSLSEAKQMAEMLSSAKRFSADAGGADASASGNGMAGGSGG